MEGTNQIDVAQFAGTKGKDMIHQVVNGDDLEQRTERRPCRMDEKAEPDATQQIGADVKHQAEGQCGQGSPTQGLQDDRRGDVRKPQQKNDDPGRDQDRDDQPLARNPPPRRRNRTCLLRLF
jgi:hypothetical protein